MEIINYLVVIGNFKVGHRIGAVLPVATYKDICVRGNSADTFNAVFYNTVPDVLIALFGNFIQKLECNASVAYRITLRNMLPKLIKTLLQCGTFKKSRLIFTLVKRKSCGLVEVDYDVQSIVFSPLYSIVYVAEALFIEISVFIFKKIVVNRETDVICHPSRYHFDVLLGDKAVVMLLCVAALGKPAA